MWITATIQLAQGVAWVLLSIISIECPAGFNSNYCTDGQVVQSPRNISDHKKAA